MVASSTTWAGSGPSSATSAVSSAEASCRDQVSIAAGFSGTAGQGAATQCSPSRDISATSPEVVAPSNPAVSAPTGSSTQSVVACSNEVPVASSIIAPSMVCACRGE